MLQIFKTTPNIINKAIINTLLTSIMEVPDIVIFNISIEFHNRQFQL